MKFDISKSDGNSAKDAEQPNNAPTYDELNYNEMDVVVGSGSVTGSHSKHAPGP